MLYTIIIILAAVFGIYALTLQRDLFARVILILMILAVALTLCPSENMKTIGFQFYLLPVGLAILYALLKKGFSVRKRSLLLLIALPVFCANLFVLYKWPSADIISMMCLVSVIAFLIICFKSARDYKNEIGFLAILAADAVIKAAIAIV